MSEKKIVNMEPSAIAEALRSHYLWATQHIGRAADLSLCNLSGFNFARAVLRGAKLTGSQMCECILIEICMSTECYEVNAEINLSTSSSLL